MTRTHRQSPRWGFAAFGLALSTAVLAVEGSVSHPAVDLLALSALAVAVFVLLRARPTGYETELLLDATVLAIGVALVSWVWVVEPLVGPAPGLVIELGWLACSVLLTAGALHPRVRRLPVPVFPHPGGPSRKRLCLLAGACLLAPLTLGVQALRGADLHLDATLVGWALMVGMVAARMGGLMHLLDAAIHRREQARRHDGVLARVASALVAAEDRPAVHRAALDAARELLTSPQAAVLAIFERRPGGPFLKVVGDAGIPPGAQLPAIGARVHASLRQGRPADLTLRPPLAHLFLPATGGVPEPGRPTGEGRAHLTLFPLPGDTDRDTVLAVVTGDPLDEDTRDRLQSLSSSSALALQRVVLSEQVLRRRSDERLTALVRNTTDLIVVVGANGRVRFATPSASAALGALVEGQRPLTDAADPDDAAAVHAFIARLAAGEQVPHLECRLGVDGHRRDYEIVGANLLEDPNVAGIVLTGRDITERKALQEQLHRRAMFDPLTGLANRTLFGELVEGALQGPGTVAVLFIDLDDFKIINDSMGHAAGDLVISAAAGRLRHGLRTGDTAARLGGDEFAVLLPAVRDAGEAQAVAERVLEAFGEPFQLEGRQFAVQASIGIAVARTQPPSTAEDLLRNADLAMYRAKAAGKGRAACYVPDLHRGVLSRLDRQAELAAALQRGDIVPHYQPVVRLTDDTLAGVEVLARWRHPRLGLLPAAQFLEVAEQSRLILPLGEHILTEACHQVAHWRTSTAARDLFLSVNLCHRQLQAPDLVVQVRRALDASDLPAGVLVLELPEACLLHEPRDALDRLAALRALGVQVAIAGFGTGSLSLSSLASMTADQLKLDRALLAPPNGHPGAGALATAVSQLVRGLGLPVVAQGVETAAQRASLRALGCTYGQGLLFGGPSEPQVFGAFLPLRAGQARLSPAG